MWRRWSVILFAAFVVGAVGIRARDWQTLHAPCAYCKKECRVRPLDEVPLHEGCRAAYADSKSENWEARFRVTREQVVGDKTKTQVTDTGATITGSIGVYNQTDYPQLISAPTKMIAVNVAGSIWLVIEDITTGGWSGPDPQPDTDESYLLTFAISIIIEASPLQHAAALDHEFAYVTGVGDDDIERTFSVSSTGRRLWRTETTTPGSGRDASPVFADDIRHTDEWEDLDPRNWSAELSGLSASGTCYDADGPPQVSSIGYVVIYFNQHKGANWQTYAIAQDLEWSKATIDFSGMSKTYGTAYKVTGSAGQLELTANTNPGTYESTWQHGLPLIPDFRDVVVGNRDGDLISNARLAGPWRASLEVPDSLNWSTDP